MRICNRLRLAWHLTRRSYRCSASGNWHTRNGRSLVDHQRFIFVILPRIENNHSTRRRMVEKTQVTAEVSHFYFNSTHTAGFSGWRNRQLTDNIEMHIDFVPSKGNLAGRTEYFTISSGEAHGCSGVLSHQQDDELLTNGTRSGTG